jgi:hypothetical protein
MANRNVCFKTALFFLIDIRNGERKYTRHSDSSSHHETHSSAKFVQPIARQRRLYTCMPR